MKSKVLSRGILFLLLGINIQLIIGCAQKKSSTIESKCLSKQFYCLQGTMNIEMQTSKGTIKIKLDGKNAPITAGNFVDLIKRKTYNKTLFHRVVKYPINFVVQGGDPSTKDPNTSKNDYGKGTFIDKESGSTRYIPLEIKLKNEKNPRYGKAINDKKELLNIALPHRKGSIAMARSQSPDSASSQFYIALRNLPELDGRYSVFGKVIEGMNILQSIEQGDIINYIKIISPKEDFSN